MPAGEVISAKEIMNVKHALLFVMLLLSAAYGKANEIYQEASSEKNETPPNIGCSSQPGANRVIHKILLGRHVDGPFFYHIWSQYVIIISPSILIQHIKSQVEKYPNAGSYYDSLLKKVEADMPIKEDTHIEKYLLQDSNVINEIQDIIFGLLSEGKVQVRILTSASKAPLPFIHAVDNRVGDWIFRSFCTPDGGEFFNHLSGSPTIN
ncbi:hypothetical protein [Undibacterium jejuense]|nr:hypothetical protein [Undibacterium jejuense]